MLLKNEWWNRFLDRIADTPKNGVTGFEIFKSIIKNKFQFLT